MEKNKWFASFINFGNFIVATSITYLLSLLITLNNANQEISLNINYKNEDFMLFFIIILFIILSWMFYEIKMNTFDTDKKVSGSELSSFLIFISSIIMITLALVLKIERNSINGELNFCYTLLGIAFFFQSISDAILIASTVKYQQGIQALSDQFGMKYYLRLTKRFLTRLFLSVLIFAIGISYSKLGFDLYYLNLIVTSLIFVLLFIKIIQMRDIIAIHIRPLNQTP